MEQNQTARQRSIGGLLAFAAIIIIIAAIRSAADLIVPFLLALSIAILCLPPLTWMQRHRIPTPAAVLVLVVFIVAGFFGVGFVIGHSIGNFVNDLPNYQNRLQGVLKGLIHLAHHLGWNISAASLGQQFNPDRAFSFVTQFFRSLGRVLGDGFLIVLTVLFLLFEASVLPGKLKVMPEESGNHRSVEVFTAFVDSMQRYVFLKTVLSIGLGVLVSLVLWGLGVHYPLLWGLLAFMLNFVPNIGAFLSAIPAILLALMQGGWPLFWYSGSVLFVIHFVTGNIIEPVLMGERLGLSTLIVFVSLILWGWVLGPVGMLLSVPLTMIIRIGLEANPQTRWIAVLLGPAPTDGRQNWVLKLWKNFRTRTTS